MDFTPYIQRYENELINEVIPFWEDHCVDHEFGGYFTSLDRDISPASTGMVPSMTPKNICGCSGGSFTCSPPST